MTAGLPRMAHFAVACSLFYLFALFTAGAIRSVVEQYAMLGEGLFLLSFKLRSFPGQALESSTFSYLISQYQIIYFFR